MRAEQLAAVFVLVCCESWSDRLLSIESPLMDWPPADLAADCGFAHHSPRTKFFLHDGGKLQRLTDAVTEICYGYLIRSMVSQRSLALLSG